MINRLKNMLALTKQCEEYHNLQYSHLTMGVEKMIKELEGEEKSERVYGGWHLCGLCGNTIHGGEECKNCERIKAHNDIAIEKCGSCIHKPEGTAEIGKQWISNECLSCMPNFIHYSPKNSFKIALEEAEKTA